LDELFSEMKLNTNPFSSLVISPHSIVPDHLIAVGHFFVQTSEEPPEPLT